MESPDITEDYYNTLEVNQNPTLELITRSYRRLASEVRPRNGGYTQAYQPVRTHSLSAELEESRTDTQNAAQLALAYETLKDENKRREYDLIYPLIRHNQTNTHQPRRSHAPATQPRPRPSYNVSAETHRNLQHAGAALMQARDAARRMEEKAEIAIEQTRRFREMVEAARTGHGGTRQARASACYYEGEWRKIDGGALCPQCLDVCTYQLSCPDCGVNTCRRCLQECRLRFPHNKGKMARTALAKRREA
jgi:DnaJ-class molecular chaperone